MYKYMNYDFAANTPSNNTPTNNMSNGIDSSDMMNSDIMNSDTQNSDIMSPSDTVMPTIDSNGRTQDTPMTLPSYPNPPVYDTSQDQQTGSDIPTTLPSFPNTPVYDTSQNTQPGLNIPVTLPSFPDTPVYNTQVPVYPNVSVERYTYIRILHANETIGAVNVLINGKLIASGLTYGALTSYTTESPGAILITVVSTNNPAQYVAQETLSFNNGTTYTVALIASMNGMVSSSGFSSTLYQIEDTSCTKAFYNSCMRAVNLAVDTGAVNVALADGRIIAKDLSYLAISAFRQFTPGRYRVIVYESSCNSSIQPRATISIIPIIVGNASSTCTANLLLSTEIEIASNKVYTSYILGSPYTSGGMKFLFAESFIG